MSRTQARKRGRSGRRKGLQPADRAHLQLLQTWQTKQIEREENKLGDRSERHAEHRAVFGWPQA